MRCKLKFEGATRNETLKLICVQVDDMLADMDLLNVGNFGN